jgi:hypothetical protein
MLQIEVVHECCQFWDIASRSPYVNRRFRRTYHLQIQGSKSAQRETSVQKVSSRILHVGFLLGWFSILNMKVIRSSETSAYIRTKWRCIPEDGNIHNCRCENIKSYIYIVYVRKTILYYVTAIILPLPRPLSFWASFPIQHRIRKI